MAEKVIWNNNRTMNFIAAEYLAARITYPSLPAHEGRHWVRVLLKGTSLHKIDRYTGICYAACKSEEDAKRCLAALVVKLELAGVIKPTDSTSNNRFDHIDVAEDTP